MVVLASLGVGVQGATQYFAWRFQYHESLGTNVNHFYPPWSILKWSSAWYERYPDEFMQAASVGVLIASVGLIGAAIAKSLASNKAKANRDMH